MERKPSNIERLINLHLLSEEKIHHMPKMTLKRSFLARKDKVVNWKTQIHELRFIESKKNIVVACMDFIGIIIIIISLIYADNEFSFNVDESVQKSTLLLISILTLAYSFLKGIKAVFYRKILISTKFLNRDGPLVTKRVLLMMFVYFIHPNYWMNNLSVVSYFVYPEQPFEHKINFFFLSFQISVIFSELIRRITIASYIKEEDKVLIRRNKTSNNCFYFSLKYLFTEYPFYVLLSYLVSFALYLSLLLKLFESPIELRDQTSLSFWSNAIWTSFVTMLTIGYGDFAAITYLGRTVSVLTGIFGYIIFSLFVIAISNSIRFKSSEYKTYLVVEKRRLKKIYRERAATLIVVFFKCYLSYKKREKARYQWYKMRVDHELVNFKSIKQKFISKNVMKNFNRQPTNAI